MSEPVTCIQKQPPTHTPGPWSVEDRRNHFSIYQVPEGRPAHFRGETVAVIHFRRHGAKRGMPVRYTCTDEMEANARLIAQAPALLAFAERTLPQLIAERDCYYEGCTNHLGEYDEGIEGDEDRETVQQFDREIDALRDLIAAAKGEQA